MDKVPPLLLEETIETCPTAAGHPLPEPWGYARDLLGPDRASGADADTPNSLERLLTVAQVLLGWRRSSAPLSWKYLLAAEEMRPAWGPAQ